jgi:hypothetical protein
LEDLFPSPKPQTPTRLLGEDWIFASDRYEALAKLEVVHQQLTLCEAPLAVLRRISLGRANVTVKLSIALTLNRAEDAVGLLFDFAHSHARGVPVERVSNTAEAMAVGDFGFTWSWEEAADPDVVAFVRHNVLVILQGHKTAALLAAAAREIDMVLRTLRTVDAYHDLADGFFSNVRHTQGSIPKVSARARLALGADEAGERYFFMTDKGSVNRDSTRENEWYYRAGIEKGRREITLIRLGSGILPIKERLAVDVE